MDFQSWEVNAQSQIKGQGMKFIKVNPPEETPLICALHHLIKSNISKFITRKFPL